MGTNRNLVNGSGKQSKVNAGFNSEKNINNNNIKMYRAEVRWRLAVPLHSVPIVISLPII